jgi:hypothetical protein
MLSRDSQIASRRKMRKLLWRRKEDERNDSERKRKKGETRSYVS